MRKMSVLLCLIGALAVYFGSPSSAKADYYGGFWYGLFGLYGPYYDCNGSRCYMGPPYTYERHNGHLRRVPGLYYYPPYSGYNAHGW
jgi:hypothetical protein